MLNFAACGRWRRVCLVLISWIGFVNALQIRSLNCKDNKRRILWRGYYNNNEIFQERELSFAKNKWWKCPSPIEIVRKSLQIGRKAVVIGLPGLTLLPKAAFASGGGGALAPGPMRDALVLLACAAVIGPTLKNWGLSPILGFLSAGAVLGPGGLGAVSQVQTTKALAEIGVTIFLFEMGLGLSFERLNTLRREIFGLGVAQYFLTTAVLAISWFSLLPNALISTPGLTEKLIVSSALALSSSVFALQLLRDRDELSTSHGRSAFGVLLFQDLAVVPLLVALPILATSGVSSSAAHIVWTSLGLAGLKAAAALGFAELIGKRILDGLFYFAAKSRSQEAFLSVVLLTVLGMGAITDSLGLSKALGAFLAGVALSETRYRYQVEADVAPFRALLLGLFFVTAGFALDAKMLASKPLQILGLAFSIIFTKASVLFLLARIFRRLPSSDALRLSLLLAPGGEFTFVVLGSAAVFNVLPQGCCDLLQITTALTMASTPFLNTLAIKLAPIIDKLEAKLLGDKAPKLSDGAVLSQKKNPVVVCGYGRVGKVVCELLDAKFVDYVAFDLDPKKATDARAAGKPVFFGDLAQTEVLDYFKIGDAKLVVVAVSDQKAINRIVVGLRRKYPDLDIIARATDKQHQQRLNDVLGVVALVPAIPENSRLLSLPFAGSVLKALNYEDVDIIIEESRRSALGLYSGQQSATLIDEEQEALLEQLGLSATNNDQDDENGTIMQQGTNSTSVILDVVSLDNDSTTSVTGGDEKSTSSSSISRGV
mmetsp:Transcript_18748/g.28283  ORF Transcript_18748/g.28283 Transcript_18748/m.28283 type:complete len:769 (-) Transcript_18748:324-2630(-)